MFENLRNKELLLFLRLNNLKAARIALQTYSWSNDKKFFDYAKTFGQMALDNKTELSTLTK